MLDRVQGLMDGLKQVSNDIAYDSEDTFEPTQTKSERSTPGRPVATPSP
jgi:hypothetical protein